MALISDNSNWLILLCMLTGFILAGILYYKSDKDGFSSRKRMLLAGLRFLSVFTISFLLLDFLLKIEFRKSEDPIVVLLHDNSESLSDFAKKNPQWPARWSDFSNELNKHFEVEQLTLGQNLSRTKQLSFSEKQTQIAQALKQIKSQYYGRNLAAVVLASDGIYTAGEHPLQASESMRTPVFSVALGDTTQYKDIAIHKVNYNKYAYLGNQFPIEIELHAIQCTNTNAILTIQTAGEVVFTKNISINQPMHIESVEYFEKAKETGVYRYTISVSTIQNERNVANNRNDFFVEVLDNRRKILLLGATPHPDISAIKQSILESERYDVDLILEDPPSDLSLEKYDVVILHQIPAKNGSMSRFIRQILEKKIPIWTIIGTQTELNVFNKMDLGITIQSQGTQSNEAFPSFNSTFTNFSLSDEVLNHFHDIPPLNVPFAIFTVAKYSQIFLFQKILNVTTDMPLMVVGQNASTRFATLLGEGIWRWRLNEYFTKKNHEAVDELINKTIQYLSANPDRRQFRVNVKPVFDEFEPIEMTAELYDDSYEPVTSADVSIEIKNSDGDVYPFSFSSAGQAYKLRAGLLPVDDYTYIAKTKLGAKNHQAEGRFAVKVSNTELLNLRADHQLLNLISTQTEAKMFYPNQLSELRDLLISHESVKPVTYIEKGFFELINLKWILAFLFFILTLEYFLRRYYGAY